MEQNIETTPMGGFAIRNLILFNQALWGNGHGNMLQRKKLSGGGLWRRNTIACGEYGVPIQSMGLVALVYGKL